MITTLALVAAGGAIGSALRYIFTLAALRLAGPGFPVATLCVNVLGSALIGVLAVLLLGPKGPAPIAPFLITGVLGGFTTFSAFSLDTLRLFEAGQTLQAGAYVLASVLLSLLAVALGAALARGVFA